jgi:hypothetical protein
MSDLTLVKFLRADRGPQGNYGPGDVAGFKPEVAKKLVTQGFAELHDAGKGLGKVNPLAIAHLREAWEADDDPAWLARAKTVEAAKADQAAQAAKSR